MPAGRPKGIGNHRTAQVAKILADCKCEPVRILAKIANGEPMKSGLMIEGIPSQVEATPSLDQRITATKELMSYVSPKLKAIEHTTLDDEGEVTGIEIRLIRPSD